MRQNYDYSRTMMLKLMLSIPDHKGGSIVYHTFESALDIIRQVDNITMGCPKIIYLVGWQYNGHDDKYPAFFAANDKLKRAEDATADDSLRWLMTEAKKYNTDVSLHVNLTDAYPSSPLWDSYIQQDLILCGSNGKPKVTGVWGGEKAYQVIANREIKSGMFYQRVDRLLGMFPEGMLKTIHVDAFFVRRGKGVTIAEEKVARRQMIEYFNIKGVDMTSEFIYRELNCGIRCHYGESDVIGVIPAFWNPVYSNSDIIKYPANVLAGNYHCKALTLDKSMGYLVYGNIWGENIFKNTNWQENFAAEFATYNLPYFFLNGYKRLKVVGALGLRKLVHSGDVVSSIKGKQITQDAEVLKNGDELILPLRWLKNTYAMFTRTGGKVVRRVRGKSVDVYEITAEGEVKCSDFSYSQCRLTINAKASGLYKVVAKF